MPADACHTIGAAAVKSVVNGATSTEPDEGSRCAAPEVKNAGTGTESVGSGRAGSTLTPTAASASAARRRSATPDTRRAFWTAMARTTATQRSR